MDRIVDFLWRLLEGKRLDGVLIEAYRPDRLDLKVTGTLTGVTDRTVAKLAAVLMDSGYKLALREIDKSEAEAAISKAVSRLRSVQSPIEAEGRGENP